MTKVDSDVLEEQITVLAKEIYVVLVSATGPTSSDVSFKAEAERSFAAASAFYETAALIFPGNKSQDRTDAARGIFRGIHGTDPREAGSTV